jgi:hypothetical protein
MNTWQDIAESAGNPIAALVYWLNKELMVGPARRAQSQTDLSHTLMSYVSLVALMRFMSYVSLVALMRSDDWVHCKCHELTWHAE